MTQDKAAFLDPLQEDLEKIETALEKNLDAYLEIVTHAASHLLFSGGKRLRPLLMLLSSRLCGREPENAISLSTIFEYLHTASLLHDDLVDEAEVRRGNPVAHSVYGNAVAVLVGDFLVARSISIATTSGKLAVIKEIAKLAESMTQGEIHQLTGKGRLDLSEDEYMTVIRNKTAVLIRGACIVGGEIADADEKAKQHLGEYGLNLGIAFQMADDLLDYISDTTTLGKEVGRDIQEGKITLPLIHALGQADPVSRDHMENIIQKPEKTSEDIGIIVEYLNRFGGIEYTRKKAKAFVNKAVHALSSFQDSKTKQILAALAEYALFRDK